MEGELSLSRFCEAEEPPPVKAGLGSRTAYNEARIFGCSAAEPRRED